MTREEALQILDTIPTIGEQVDALELAIEVLEQEPCEDCISRQQAIDKMQELENEDIKAYGCEIPEGFDGKRAIEALKALPSIQPKPKTEWIPISERLPEELKGVLVYCPTNDNIYCAYLEKGAWKIFSPIALEDIKEIVTAWMPLLEPYKAESKDK